MDSPFSFGDEWVMIQQDTTISAIATPLGEGGIGIIRISGQQAISIAARCFVPASGKELLAYPSRTAVFGRVEAENGEFLDEAICLIMRGPHSYTCEDVVELQCHGGGIVLQEILALTYRLGARPAERGEFTKRAFLNGRLDLSQAQAVMDVIQARTKASLAVAESNLKGKFSQEIKSMRQSILGLIAHLEASIDFPEDDIENVVLTDSAQQVEAINAKLQQLLASAHTGIILRDGLQTAIIGKPNAGKSSLMNLLLGEERAIVTDIPGTTRDSIEEYVNLGGIPLRLVDTAGIRETDNLVEQIGVAKAYSYAKEAELVLAVLDSSEELAGEQQAILELLDECQGQIILILNKSDLTNQPDMEKLQEIITQKEVDKIYKIIQMSAKAGQGMESLEEAIKELVYGGKVEQGEGIMVNDARQAEILRQASELLHQTQETLAKGFSEDFVVIDLRAVWEKLGEITGENLGEDIIDEIFSKFCIGK